MENENKPINNGYVSQLDKDTNDSFFSIVEVNKGISKHIRNQALKIRLQVLIKSKGISEADFYKSLGFTKQYWYLLSNGLQEVPIQKKVLIAQKLGVDSAVIFQEDQN